LGKKVSGQAKGFVKKVGQAPCPTTLLTLNDLTFEIRVYRGT